MANVEKVKQGLRCCKNSYPKDCKHCPYEKDCTHHETCDILIRNALSVIEQMEQEIERLKEQKSVEPKTGHWICGEYDDIFMCSSCEKYSMDDYPYCHWCGAKMKQEGW